MSDTTEKKAPGAKDISLKSMIISAVWIALWTITKALWAIFTKSPFGLDMNDIILSGIVIAAVFSPVYLAIILDKIKEIKISKG